MPTPTPPARWQFQRAVVNLAQTLPQGRYRKITVDLIAACIAFGKAAFTMQVDADSSADLDTAET